MSSSPPCSSQVRWWTGVGWPSADRSSLRILWQYLDGSYFMVRFLVPFWHLSCRIGRTRPNLLTTQSWNQNTQMAVKASAHTLSFHLLCVCESPQDWSFWFSQHQSILNTTIPTGRIFPTLCPGTSLPGTAAFMVKLSTPALLSESSIFCLWSSVSGCWRFCFAISCRSSASLKDRNHRLTVNNNQLWQMNAATDL